MKPLTQIVALVSLLSLTPAAGMAADAKLLLTPIHRLEGGVLLGLFMPSKQHELYDNSRMTQVPLSAVGVDLGLRFAYLPIPIAGVEAEAAFSPVGSDRKKGGVVNFFRGHLLLQYPWKVTPFAVMGVGSMGIWSSNGALGNDQDLTSHMGLGAKYELNRFLVGRLDVRQTIAPRARSLGYTTHYEVLLGLSGFLARSGGEPAPAPVPVEAAAPLDTDGDGFTDDVDQCPKLPAKTANGCPILDTDKDGIIDSDDRCPTEAEDKDGFEDQDGCPDLDNDHDGIPDASDKCPNESETLNGVEDEDGCPENLADEDKDGVVDSIDKCARDPEDKDGFEDADGCPDPDNDKDGVIDNVDGCPDKAGPAENHGCPDIDTDSDGVVDRLDNCPSEPGLPENSGCKAKQLVRLQADKIEILEKVFFATGKDVIEAKSFPLLENIAAVLAAHPEIAKLRIEGHTDDQGNPANNQKLSQARADAVVLFLTRKGVASSRLEAAGFGQGKPIAPNTTAKGRGTNRRVEFVIVR